LSCRAGSEEAAAFLKKSGAKNFCYPGAGMFWRQWPKLKKSFWFAGGQAFSSEKELLRLKNLVVSYQVF
jgi:hypothetical protein